MDEKTVSKETLIMCIRDAISHTNRNIYEWTSGEKKGKAQFVISHCEVRGLIRNWLVRALRDKIGYGEADRLFRHMYISMDTENSIIGSIELSSEGRYSQYYTITAEILRSMNYLSLKYNPNDYIMDGMSEKRDTFDPFFYFSIDKIKSINF